MNWLYLFKSLHIIGFVTWFAGMFYLVRLFVYHREAFDKPDGESDILKSQYQIMESRLFTIITRPGMIFTWLAGIAMILYHPDYLTFGWMHVKLFLLVFLSIYTEKLPRIIKNLSQGEKVMSSFSFRLFNELPTLFLIAIVLLAVYKDLISMLWIFGILIIVSIALFLFAHAYKKRRIKNSKQ
jgi:protoporphyrinogen IX oxidase